MYESNGATSAGETDGGMIAGEATSEQALQVHSHSNQLTLSFQGEVYVFDSVQPERVQAVLLLLGGQELSPEVAHVPDNFNQRLANDFSRSCNNPRRMASIMRYREKRKHLSFEKKVIYEVRKDVASRMKRNKGQFASSKANSEEAVLPFANGHVSHSNSREETGSSYCQHCGISKDMTPLMRRGPAGPRTLCNACGLMWANKGLLKSLPPSATPIQTINPPEQLTNYPADQGDVNGSEIESNGHLFSPSMPEAHMINEIDAKMNFVDN